MKYKCEFIKNRYILELIIKRVKKPYRNYSSQMI